MGKMEVQGGGEAQGVADPQKTDAVQKAVKKFGYFCTLQKSTQSKQSPNGRKFAISGHPGTKVDSLRFCKFAISSGEKKVLRLAS
jgi:hypothetical protein